MIKGIVFPNNAAVLPMVQSAPKQPSPPDRKEAKVVAVPHKVAPRVNKLTIATIAGVALLLLVIVGG